MIPNNATPARRAARRECLPHDLMGDLAAQERTEAFEGARDALVRASAVRHALATVELREARDADCEPAGTVLGRIWQAG